jgi:hypothetical protein
MSDHPRIRVFLARLLQLNELDAQLPLEILVNLHRTRLRAPLETLSWLERRQPPGMPRQWAIENLVGERYPLLRGGKIWAENAVYHATQQRHDMERRHLLNRQLDKLVQGLPPTIAGLLDNANQSFMPYEPMSLCYMLTLPSGLFEAHCELLELALDIDPQIETILLELADEEPQAKSP